MGTEPPTPSTLTDDNDNDNNKYPADIQSEPPSQIKPDHPTKPTCSHIYISHLYPILLLDVPPSLHPH